MIKQAAASGKKIKNFDLAKEVGIEVEQQTLGDMGVWEEGYERRVVSVAVSRKKRVAIDAIANVVNGIFP